MRSEGKPVEISVMNVQNSPGKNTTLVFAVEFQNPPVPSQKIETLVEGCKIDTNNLIFHNNESVRFQSKICLVFA